MLSAGARWPAGWGWQWPPLSKSEHTPPGPPAVRGSESLDPEPSGTSPSVPERWQAQREWYTQWYIDSRATSDACNKVLDQVRDSQSALVPLSRTILQ